MTSLYGSLSKNGGIVVLYNFLAYVPSIFLFLCLQHLATLWVNKTEYYVMCPMIYIFTYCLFFSEVNGSIISLELASEGEH